MIPHQGSIALPLADPGHLKIKEFDLQFIFPQKGHYSTLPNPLISSVKTPGSLSMRHQSPADILSEPYHVQSRERTSLIKAHQGSRTELFASPPRDLQRCR